MRNIGTDLVLMYFADIAPAGTLAALVMVPLQIRNFRLVRPSTQDVCWMQQTLDRESRKFGANVGVSPHVQLTVSWKAGDLLAGGQSVPSPL